MTFDLTSGKLAGDVLLQPKSDPFGGTTGIVFSPDGTEIAVLWRLLGKKDQFGKVMVFDSATGKRVATHELNDLTSLESGAHGGLDCIQWVSDGSGWLLYGTLLVDRKTGKELGRIGGEKKFGQRRFIGPELLTSFKGGLDPSLSLESVRITGR